MGQFGNMGYVQKVLKIILLGIMDVQVGKVQGGKVQNLDFEFLNNYKLICTYMT